MVAPLHVLPKSTPLPGALKMGVKKGSCPTAHKAGANMVRHSVPNCYITWLASPPRMAAIVGMSAPPM